MRGMDIALIHQEDSSIYQPINGGLMIRGIWSSMSGMIPRMFNHEVAANNLANITTTGFKGERAFVRSFIDAEMMAEKDPDRYHRISDLEDVKIDFSQGLMEETHNPFDIAILGNGFFSVRTAQGDMFTRNGHFKIDKNYQLVNSEDLPVLDTKNRPIKLFEGDIFIRENGEIAIDGDVVAQIKVTDFPQPYNLKKSVNNMFTPEDEQTLGFPAKDFAIKHGFLERSNVTPVREMLNMIIYFRNYEADSRILMAQDDTLRRAVTDVGRPA